MKNVPHQKCKSDNALTQIAHVILYVRHIFSSLCDRMYVPGIWSWGEFLYMLASQSLPRLTVIGIVVAMR